MYVMDGIPRDHAERGPQTADDAPLFAMGDVVTADYVVTDSLLVPSILERTLDGLDVTLG